jgi:hypothetical protein
MFHKGSLRRDFLKKRRRLGSILAKRGYNSKKTAGIQDCNFDGVMEGRLSYELRAEPGGRIKGDVQRPSFAGSG